MNTIRILLGASALLLNSIANAAIIEWRIDFTASDNPQADGRYINVQSGYASVFFDTDLTRVVIDTDETDVIQWWAIDYKVVMDDQIFLPDAQILTNGQPLSVVNQEEKRIGLTQGPFQRIAFDFELLAGAFFDAYIRSDIRNGGSDLLTNGVFSPAELPLFADDLNLTDNVALVSLEDGTAYWAQIASIKEVPEPSVLALIFTGLLGLIGFSMRRKANA